MREQRARKPQARRRSRPCGNSCRAGVRCATPRAPCTLVAMISTRRDQRRIRRATAATLHPHAMQREGEQQCTSATTASCGHAQHRRHRCRAHVMRTADAQSGNITALHASKRIARSSSSAARSTTSARPPPSSQAAARAVPVPSTVGETRTRQQYSTVSAWRRRGSRRSNSRLTRP